MASEQNTNGLVPARADTKAGGEVVDTLVLDQPSYIPGLSPAQEKALAALVDGKTAVEAAALAGVSRMTIYRWQHNSGPFIAALNLCRQQAHDAFARRLSRMNDAALSVLARLLEKGDFRAAKLVISFVESQRDLRREFMEARETFNEEERVARHKEFVKQQMQNVKILADAKAKHDSP